jgi:hypothetical protein
MGRVYRRPVCKRYAYRRRRAFVKWRSCREHGGRRAGVEDDTRRLRIVGIDVFTRRSQCGTEGLESLLDGGTGVGRTRHPYIVDRECRSCRCNHSWRVGLVAAFAGLVGDEPAAMGARAFFPNFPNLTVVAVCLVVVALQRCRHGGERGGTGGEAASDDALNLSHILKCDRCTIIMLLL